MYTPQEPLTPSLPPPCSVENFIRENRGEFAASGTNINPNLGEAHMDNNELPGRCQFTFSDGRQCRMARSEIHPSLCPFHSEREEQLFGEPGSHTFGAAFDLPELHSACRDLSTAAGVNRALAEVFRLLARRRISRPEAATFAKLGQLLLQSISAVRADDHAISTVSPKQHHQPASTEPLPADKVHRERETFPACSVRDKTEPPPGGFVMRQEESRDASPIFCRPAMPVVSEERFVLSGHHRPLTPEDQHSPNIPSQLPQNEHLQNLEI